MVIRMGSGFPTRGDTSIVSKIKSEFPVGSRIEITVKEGAEFCNYMTTPFFSFHKQTDAPSVTVAGYIAEDRPHEADNRVLVAFSWDHKNHRSAGLGAVAVYENAILKYAK